MAKVTGPILSIGARGQIGRSQVYGVWRGIPYARQYLVPGNPNTIAQQSTRNTFRTLMELWKESGTFMQSVYLEAARGRPFTDRNKLVQTNLTALRGQANMQAFLASPGVAGGVPLTSMVVSAGAGQLTATFTLGTLPTGWTTTRAVAITFPDQDPALPFVGPVTQGEDLVTPFAVVLTGLGTGTLRVVSGWWEMAKADGSFAASIAITATGTPT